jgi:hypothetical protein
MRNSTRKSWLASTAIVIALFAAAACTPCFALPDNGASQPAVSLSFSPGVRDILKMLDAKVDIGVITAFIKTSPVPFSPSASEIIALKQRDVPDEVITTLILRGAEVRNQMAQAAQVPPMTGQAATAPVTPPDYGAAAPYYADASYADSGYGYPYYSGYPYNYWGYNYSYPLAWYSPFYYGYYGYRYRGGYNHWGHYYAGYPYRGAYAYRGGYPHGGYPNRGGYPGSYQNRVSYANHSAPWAPASGNYAYRPAVGGRNFAYSAPRAYTAPRAYSAPRAGGFGGGGARPASYGGGHMGGFGGGGHGGGGGGGHR